MAIERQRRVGGGWSKPPDALRCQSCGAELPTRHNQAGSPRLYCDATCSKRAYRARQAASST